MERMSMRRTLRLSHAFLLRDHVASDALNEHSAHAPICAFVAMLATALVLGACPGNASSSARGTIRTPSETTVAPSPPPTELSVPPIWVRDAKTIPNPPIGGGTPWLLAAADRDGDQLIVRNRRARVATIRSAPCSPGTSSGAARHRRFTRRPTTVRSSRSPQTPTSSYGRKCERSTKGRPRHSRHARP